MESDHEIQELIGRYEQLEPIVEKRMYQTLKEEDGFPLLHITHRIKTLDSIKGKMVRKPNIYPSVYEIRDILGFRVICYFSSTVDLVAKRLAERFRVDWDLSKDKRKQIDARSFGYLSLHFICSLPEGEEFSDLWFEIQIRTILQHSWAEIEHDLGYKTEIEIPRAIRRDFSRAASLLETTDILFSQIKKSLEDYEAQMKENIETGSLKDVYFDRITLKEFVAGNDAYRNLLFEIAEITGAHITEGEGRTENLLLQLEFLGIISFRDMIKVIEKEHDVALELAKQSLQYSEMDELSSTVAFHYLFRAFLIESTFSKEKIAEFFSITMKDSARISRNTNRIMEQRALV